MSQSSVAAYFNKRKRAAVDELANVRSKTQRIDSPTPSLIDDNVANGKLITSAISDKLSNLISNNGCIVNGPKIITSSSSLNNNRTTNNVDETKRPPSTRLKQCLRSTKRPPSQDSSKSTSLQPKILKFTIDEHKEKDATVAAAATTTELLSSNKADALSNIDFGMKTPTKEQQIIVVESAKRISARKNLSLDDIKTKLNKSSKLQDLKASLSRLNKLEEARQKNVEKSGQLKTHDTIATDVGSTTSSIFNRTGRAANILAKGLKEFKSIDLEVLTSPKKGFTTPTKFITPQKSETAGKNELMSPKKSATRRLFSPTKASPIKNAVDIPAYQRFQDLVDAGKPTLQLPYKYRCLEEAFKCLDTVCSMFFNRHETITMKKLKPAVQRMLRKNFTETHLAQIKHIYPDAYNFYQKKMLNAGSHTKYDYYQLVVVPNVKSRTTDAKDCAKPKADDEANIIKAGDERTMNPQVMIQRQRELHRLLLNVVKDEHEKFLQTLVPPMTIPKDKLTRWHPEFDLNNCADIERAPLPLPPNVDKFSSAKDVLSTARNLFNCSTPMERAMDRFEASQRQQEAAAAQKTTAENTILNGLTTNSGVASMDPVSVVLKDVPKSLLERIRAKQAAKALDQMTRRPSQDKEACKFSRLPELARHMRNIFVTERKGCLELDSVLVKLENSFREKMSRDALRELVQLLGKESPSQWLTFHHIRKMDFVKINKEVNLADVIEVLQQKATAKAS